MAHYVESRDQLVVEVYVRDMGESKRFYEALGFQLVRDASHFVELQWEDSWLFLAEIPTLPEPAAAPTCNIRIMVPDVDRYWRISQELDLRVIQSLEDRDYGLRDFTILSPDGVGLRFATRLGKS